jgi:hypothetical protein
MVCYIIIIIIISFDFLHCYSFQASSYNLHYTIRNLSSHSGCAVQGVGLGHLVTRIVGSNHAQDMDVCHRISVLCCPAEVEALRQAIFRPGSLAKC